MPTMASCAPRTVTIRAPSPRCAILARKKIVRPLARSRSPGERKRKKGSLKNARFATRAALPISPSESVRSSRRRSLCIGLEPTTAGHVKQYPYGYARGVQALSKSNVQVGRGGALLRARPRTRSTVVVSGELSHLRASPRGRRLVARHPRRSTRRPAAAYQHTRGGPSRTPGFGESNRERGRVGVGGGTSQAT